MTSIHVSRKILPRAVLIATGFCSLVVTSSAMAEYRVTAFGKTPGFSELLSNDAASAEFKLEKLSESKMGFSEMNNLCVTRILLKEFDAAITTCSTALDKAESAYDIGALEEKKAKASILSNLAVARALNGDAPGAKSDLEAALSLNSSNSNAQGNYQLIEAKIGSAEVASN